MRNDYPKLRQSGQRTFAPSNHRIEGNHGANPKVDPSKPQVKAKVFFLGRNELGANPAVVEGTLT
jgi:hypothetical protein